MELETTIIGFIGIICCIVPIMLIQKSGKKKEKELLIALQVLAKDHNMEVKEYECGLEFIIGISTDKRVVFFYKKRNETKLKEVINLETIKKCTVHTVKTNVRNKNSSESIIDKLELVFEPKGKSQMVVKLELFNSVESFLPNGELQLAKKWESIINSSL